MTTPPTKSAIVPRQKSGVKAIARVTPLRKASSVGSASHERHAGLLLWWAEGKWWVGKREELGHGRGWIKAKSEAARPDAPGAGLEWLVFSKEARTWVVADLACTPAHTVRLGLVSVSVLVLGLGLGPGLGLGLEP